MSVCVDAHVGSCAPTDTDNPYAMPPVMSPAGFALSLRELYDGFLQLRTLPHPVVGAVHGVLVGGGVAGCLHVDYLATDHASTFEHGNLVRGVCVLGMLSQTFAIALGSQAQHIYLQNARMGAPAACAAGLVQQLCVGVHASQTHVREVATCVLDSMHLAKTICCARAAINAAPLAREAVGHIECQVTNGGFAKSKLQTHAFVIEDSPNLRVVSELGSAPRRLAPMLLCEESISEEITSSFRVHVHDAAHKQLHLGARPLIAFGQRDHSCADHSRIEVSGGVVELRTQVQRLRRCCLNAKAASMCEAKTPEVHVPCPALLSFEAMGVAAIEIGASGLVPALEAARRFLAMLAPAVRAVAFHVAGNSWPSTRRSARTLEQTSQAHDALHSLGVPVVCSADDNGRVAGSVAWSAADYRVGQCLHAVMSEWAKRARERAWTFAAWLAHHPSEYTSERHAKPCISRA